MLNPLFMCDFYKIGHVSQYPSGVTKVYINWTPRTSRVPGRTHAVHFGLQYLIKKYLIEYFTNNFFDCELSDILAEYKRIISATLGVTNPRTDHIEWLHELGTLPIDIYSIPEGDSVPLGTPAMVPEEHR